jgi:S1-C subfamily serine protease
VNGANEGQGCLCTGGKVAKVVTTSDGKPGAIQTTAAVHNGNSGGALINKFAHFLFA